MNRRLQASLFLSAVIMAAAAGCSAGVTISSAPASISISNENTSTSAVQTVTTTSAPGTAVLTTSLSPSPVPSATISVSTTTAPPSTTTSAPATSAPPATINIPTFTAVYPVIINGVTTVIHADGQFAPPIIMIPVGTTVEWQVTDHLSDHVIYGDDGTWWGGVIAWIPLDKTFNTRGTFKYHDGDSMGGNGTVIVY